MIIVTRKLLLFSSFSFLYLINVLIVAQDQPEYLYHICTNDSFNYTFNSKYRTNLDAALSSLPNTNSGYGFYNSSAGQGLDRANAISLCRGDVEPGMCRSCVNESIVQLRRRCPNQSEAIIYYDVCLLRYSNATILGINGMAQDVVYMWNNNNATNGDRFNLYIRPLMETLRDKAASGGSLLKFAWGPIIGPDDITIYGLVQCTPDLSGAQCNDCLGRAMHQIPNFSIGKVGGRVLTASCTIRYEIYRFYNDNAVDPPLTSPPPPTSPPAPPPPGKSTSTTRTMAILILVGFAIAVTSIGMWIIVRRKKRLPGNIDSELMDLSTVQSLHYDFCSMRAATNDFSKHNKLGQGGFGPVYKGELPSGQAIAVKRLSRDSGQGELEFMNEVSLVAKLQHRNLVRLLGFTLEGTERLLIYEFMPNGSLDQYIFDPSKRALLDWNKRYKIIGDIARGLLYLHEDSRLRVIHRDLKASNVLLDSEMDAKIADFGMARLFNPQEIEGNTNRIVGTFGYMPPEYALYGQFSVKSDVFSFGVLVLEMVSGQKNRRFLNEENVEGLLSHAWKSFRDGTTSKMIDPILKVGLGSLSEVVRSLHIGLLCVQNNVVDRPTTAMVVLMLKSSSLPLPVPSEPGFFINGNTNADMPNFEDYNTSKNTKGSQFSVNNASVTEIVPR